MIISPEIIEKIREHVKAQYPKEACGFIVGDDFIPVENIHETPETDFRVDASAYMTYAEVCTAFIHSHPDWYPVPSKTDMEQQIATGIPWGIIATNGQACTRVQFFGDCLPPLPLDNRTFVHGVTDCYSYIRDWFRIKRGVTLIEIPRSWEWWMQDGADLYKDNFERAGFVPVSMAEIRQEGPQIGDVFMATLGKSKKMNHGGVYIGAGQAAHHLTALKPIDTTRLAHPDPVERYEKYINMWVRYAA